MDFRNAIALLGGNLMAAFMDFGIGALIVSVLAQAYAVEISLSLLLISGILALLPDLDLVPAIITGKSAAFNHHETPFHRPLLMLPLVTALGYVFGGYFWSIVCFTCVFWHYLHDTKWTGGEGGIAWFWPFSRMYWSPLGAQIPSTGSEHHDWLRTNWLRPTRFSITEIVCGLIALTIALYIATTSLLLCLCAAGFVLVGVLLVWSLGAAQLWSEA